MRFRSLQPRAVGTLLLALAATSCQTAQKPASLTPPAAAPTLKAGPAQSASPDTSKPTASASQQAPSQSQSAPQQSKAESKPASASPAPVAPDRVAELISQVEKEYQAGLLNFQNGKNDAAKQNFDNAFNMLLSSDLDVRSDDRLETEFNRITDGVNRLNVDRLNLEPPGNADQEAQQQQKSEPAPIDETNEVTPAADPRIKAKAQAEIKSTRSDLPLMMTDQVAGYISYFSNRGRGIFEHAFARSGRYREMMLPILKEEGVPQDLIYLAQAESGFHPLAVSRVGARGIWQFMGSRARGYGLHHNLWVDDRQDPEKSTRAAAHHLKDLYNQFGDWYLAMAAYNSGPGTVQAAVKRTGYADFWELYKRNVLPRETRNYVPIILAVTLMAKNPGQYGLEDVSLDDPERYDTVTINYPVDLRLVAQCVGSTQDELEDLNPSLLRLTTPREGKFDLHLPAGTKDQYESAIAEIPVGMRLWWRFHSVHQGETLASVARKYHVTAKAISEANHLDAPQLETNSRLIIPIPPGKHATNDGATYARRITRYRVRKGDTIESVAANFGVSPQMLRRWNGLRGESLSGRRVLALHLPVSPGARSAQVAASKRKSAKPGPNTETATAKPPASKSSLVEKEEPQQASVVHHRVKHGETLYSIANAYHTTVEALKRSNRNVAVLRPGMILTIRPAQ